MERQATILGAGDVGAGWAARFALAGWAVRVFDTDPDARDHVAAVMAMAKAELPALRDGVVPVVGPITWHDTLSDAVAGSDWVQESLPDRLALKRKIYQAAQAFLTPGTIIASSSATQGTSELQGCATRPGDILIAVVRSPVWQAQDVTLRAGPKTTAATLTRARAVLCSIGMRSDAR